MRTIVFLVLAGLAGAATPLWADEPTYKDRKLSEWTNDLVGNDSTRRAGALEAFRALGLKAQPALADLKAALGHKDVTVRSYTITALGYLGPPAAPALIEALDD